MTKKTPRAICLDILNRMEEADCHADRLLTESFKRYRHLTPLDRAFLTELTYGIPRWRGRLDWIIFHLSAVPYEKIESRILNTLRLGLYQILFLSRTPVSAAVNESVELAKRIRGQGGAGFVNGVLRSFLRRKEEISYPDLRGDPLTHISVVQSHPVWLVRRWVEEMGVDETMRVCTFNNQISPLTLRTNTLKIDRSRLIRRLEEKGVESIPCSFSEEGILVKDPPPASELPFLREGLFIIQDEASQLVTTILDPGPGERALDGCAAPGGKATHMAQKMGNEGEIVAVDVTAEKLGRIKEMCPRLGITMIKTVRGDATKPLPLRGGEEFHRVLADVPCSGFGTLRKNPDLKWRRGEEDIRRLGDLQYRILKSLARYVRASGVLVYSTCTVFREENEEVVERFLRDHLDFRLQPAGEILPEKFRPLINEGYLKTFPPQNGMDGFFAARLVKLKRG